VKLAFGCLVGLVVIGAGCGGGGSSKSAATTAVVTTVVTQATNPTGTASVTTHGRFHYPPAVVKNYMRSCLKNRSVTQAYCGCTLDKLSNNVSTSDFARIGLSGGHIPPRIRRFIRRAAVACADKL
jgi:hypothetical protein